MNKHPDRPLPTIEPPVEASPPRPHLFRHYRNGKTYVLIRSDVLNADNKLDGSPESERMLVQYQAVGESQVYVAPIPQFFGSVPNPDDPFGPPIRRYQPIK